MLLRPMDTTFVIPIQLSPFAWTGSKIAVICPCCQIALSKPIPLLVNVNVVGPPGFTKLPLNRRGPSGDGGCYPFFFLLETEAIEVVHLTGTRCPFETSSQ